MVKRFALPLLLFAAAAVAALIFVHGVHLFGYGAGLAGNPGTLRDVRCVTAKEPGGGGSTSCTGRFRPAGGTAAHEQRVKVSALSEHQGPRSARREGDHGPVHPVGGLEAASGIGMMLSAAAGFALALGSGLVMASERAWRLLSRRWLGWTATSALLAGLALFLTTLLLA